ncbi:uncharacterized protein LOC135829359 [Sycon ciliatum]|uniref:uncharacterized protein LOC135829359 n=1 Tax=Sycon ciliatum TaxID=27933 RepID=UPI0031F61AB4
MDDHDDTDTAAVQGVVLPSSSPNLPESGAESDAEVTEQPGPDSPDLAEADGRRTIVLEAKAFNPNFFINLGWDPVWKNFRKLGAIWVLITYPHIASLVPVIGDTVTGLALSYQSLLKVWFLQSVFGFVFAADDTFRFCWSIGLSWLSCLRWMLQTLLLNDKSIDVLQGYAKLHGIKLKKSDGEEEDDEDGEDDDDEASTSLGDPRGNACADDDEDTAAACDDADDEHRAASDDETDGIASADPAGDAGLRERAVVRRAERQDSGVVARAAEVVAS